MILAQHPVMKTDAGRPNTADFLETNRRVARIGLEKLEIFVGEFADRLRLLPVVKPKFGRGEVAQSGVQRPAS